MSAVPRASRMILSLSRAIFYRWSANPNENMQNKKYVRVVIWVIVITMVLGLVFTAASLF
jgi:hypothetical protein